MEIIKTKVVYNTCKKCDYKWVSRVEKPRQCPNCKRQIKYETNQRHHHPPRHNAEDLQSKETCEE